MLTILTELPAYIVIFLMGYGAGYYCTLEGLGWYYAVILVSFLLLHWKYSWTYKMQTGCKSGAVMLAASGIAYFLK